MLLSSGSRLGAYEIHSLLGQGGMGEVYLARDSRLPRDVAIKRVKQADGGGPEGRARLVREATILAQLTHPHICTLYELVEDGGQAYLAMEALQGESLDTRLARSPHKGLPVPTVLTIGAQVAEGLAFAHGRGVTHQDIKPANILLTPAGAKVLDFGIARLRDPGAPQSRTATVTIEALASGTLPYMAPEQLDGHADARSDIFALGAVLYEMLTGGRAFAGDSTSSIIGQIVDARRPALPAGDFPAALVRLVDKCLASEAHERWQSAADLADELRWIAKGLDGLPPPIVPSRSPQPLGSGWIAAAAVAAITVIIAVAAWRLGPLARPASTPSPPPLIADVILPVDLRLVADSPPAVSPDGRYLAFAAEHESVRRLYLRDLETGDLRPLPETDNGVVPFWSPDGTALAFFASGSLKRVARDGGQPLTLAPAGMAPAGGDWSRDDVIVYTPEYLEGTLWRVSASGGMPQVVARPDRAAQDQSLVWPKFLPDGRTLLYVRDSGRADRDALMVRSLDRDDASAVDGVATSATFVAPGTLLYARNGWLVSQAFDPVRRQLSGEAQPVAGPVEIDDTLGVAVSAPSLERLVYRRPRATAAQLSWVARDGRMLEQVGRPEVGLEGIRLGAKGTRLVGHVDEGQTDLWLWDPTRGTRDRLTATNEWENSPVLSHDGRRVAFASDGRGSMDLYVRSTSGPDDRELVASEPEATLWPNDWSSDGRYLLGTGLGSTTQQDVWMFSFETRTVSWPFKTPAREGVPRLSPNGRWMAYQSDEAAGQFDVYVAALESPRERWRVSTHGGAQPRWRADGGELYFLGAAGDVHAVSVKDQGGRLILGPATRLFGVPGLNAGTWWSRYDVTPAGDRFLIAQAVSAPPVEGYALLTGWRSTARRP